MTGKPQRPCPLVPGGWSPIGWLKHLRRLQDSRSAELALLYREWADALEAKIGAEGMRREDQLYGKRFRQEKRRG